jgi:serine/threonine protein kinase
MYNKETNLKYKNKYLKYKNKYLELKNQIGGGDVINLENNTCNLDNPYSIYTQYNKDKDQCCTVNKNAKCIQMVQTIDYKDIHSDGTLVSIPSDSDDAHKKASNEHIKLYSFNIHNTYIGSEKQTLQLVDHTYPGSKKQTLQLINNITQMEIYKSFTVSNTQNIKTIYKVVLDNNGQITLLGRGSSGILLQYISANGNVFVVKYGLLGDDLNVINYLNAQKNNDKCSKFVVNFIVHTDATDDKFKCIIMENAVGTIDKLIPTIKYNPNILIKILYAIVIAIKCLYDIGLYYTDIKMENILFRYTNNGIEIILADLGSAFKLQEFPIISYPPYEFIMNENDKDFKEVGLRVIHPYGQNKLLEKNSLISWGIGILTLQLLSVYIEDLNNRHPEILKLLGTTSDDYIKKNVHDKIINNLNTHNYAFIIYNTLCSYKNRWDLTKIITRLNILRLNQYRERQKTIQPVDKAVNIFRTKLYKIRKQEQQKQERKNNLEVARRASTNLKKILRREEK